MIYTLTSCELINSMGTDLAVVNSARVSFNQLADEPELTQRDIKLLNYLADHGHTSPFEHCTATFYIKCPLFIARQIMRHRTFSYNEVSRRYTSEKIEFWAPDHMRAQATKNLQCSDGLADDQEFNAEVYDNAIDYAWSAYKQLITKGVAREQARAVLPQAMHTSFYMTGNLLNWVKFIKLRDSEHAQPEAQEVARAIKQELNDLFPYSMEAWFK